MFQPLKFLNSLLSVALQSAQPAACLPPHLPKKPKGRTVVIGAGKASAAMAAVVEGNLHWPLEGLVITRYGFGYPCQEIEVVEASHPIPDEASIKATERTIKLLKGLTKDDLVLCLISGGASSLMALPAGNITLEEKQMLTQQLLICGAPISKINTVRSHLSSVKGGGLARICGPAEICTLIISDVPRDIPCLVGSGPTLPGNTKPIDALKVLREYNLDIPSSVLSYLASDKASLTLTLPNSKSHHVIVASCGSAIEAAAAHARDHGFRTTVLGYDIEGDSKELGKKVADKLLMKGDRPHVYLSGGETTVTVRGGGKGGPNTEFLLSLAMELDERKDVFAIACDTDGIDGSEDNAGAFITPYTLSRARKLGLVPEDYLKRNDTYTFFDAIGDLVVTGPTYTNVNDFRAILVP
ncbi:MAG: glycerate kinase [Pseudomonadota bacterium]|nr:glycerate kinase [Pseudomonadota bacterium]